MNAEYAHPKPVLLKIAPDLNKIQLENRRVGCQTKLMELLPPTLRFQENLKASKETLEKLGTADFQGNQSVKKYRSHQIFSGKV